MPRIRSSYLSDPLHEKILIAVSGGSDSLSLLNLCFETRKFNIRVATVDHGLRTEAASEAHYVGDHCRTLGVPHTVLEWEPNATDSQSARLARYRLLVDYARQIDAEAILLGHTLDDQAETVLMRAKRVRANSGTLGLSGMPEIASYENIKLVRPLLTTGREELRDYLRSKDTKWIDDPSNEKLSSERVRTRKIIHQSNTLPSAASIARFATLNGQIRARLNQDTAEQILTCVRLEHNKFIFQHSTIVPNKVAAGVFAVLVQLTGEQEFRSPDSKLIDLVLAFQKNQNLRKSVGNCLISVKDGRAVFSKENRGFRNNLSAKLNGGRSQLPKNQGISEFQPLSIAPLERFRPSSDDPVFDALKTVLEKYPRST